MSINRTKTSGCLEKYEVKKVLKRAANKKRPCRRAASIGKDNTKDAILRSKAKRSTLAGANKVSVTEVEEIVSDYREHTRSKLAKDFPMIVDTMLIAAKAGKLTDTKMKLLLDLAGVKDQPEGKLIERSGPGLGELLLNEIKWRRNAAQAMLNASQEGEIPAALLSSSGGLERSA